MAPKPNFKRNVEVIVRKKTIQGDKNLDLFLKVKPIKSKVNLLTKVSKDANQYKAKTNLEDIKKIEQNIVDVAKKRFGNATLVQIKGNERDPSAPQVPNSLPRKSSILGIINAFKKEGLTQFALAVTDNKTGRLMGYTVIRIPKVAGEEIKKMYKGNLENQAAEQRFLTTVQGLIGQGKTPELYYEEALKEIFGFQIKHLIMPGYTINPVTRDFRVKTPAEMTSEEKRNYNVAVVKKKITDVRAKAMRVAEKIDATSMYPKLKKNK